MPEPVERIDVDASPEQAWATITDWERQGEWMLLTDVRTVGGPAQRLHGRLAARTGNPAARRPPPRRARHHDHYEVGAAAAGEVQHTGRIVRGPVPSRSSLGGAGDARLLGDLVPALRPARPRGWALSSGPWCGDCGGRCSASPSPRRALPDIPGTALGEDVPVQSSWAGEHT